MATAKKKPATKSTATKKAPVRKVTKKSTVSKPKTVEAQSFKRDSRKTPFMTYKFTQQSFYWLIIGALVIALGAWVMHLNIKIQRIYDQVEINSALHESYELKMQQKLEKQKATE